MECSNKSRPIQSKRDIIYHQRKLRQRCYCARSDSGSCLCGQAGDRLRLETGTDREQRRRCSHRVSSIRKECSCSRLRTFCLQRCTSGALLRRKLRNNTVVKLFANRSSLDIFLCHKLRGFIFAKRHMPVYSSR